MANHLTSFSPSLVERGVISGSNVCSLTSLTWLEFKSTVGRSSKADLHCTQKNI